MYFAGENHFFSSIFDQLSYLLIIGFNHYSMLHHRIWKIRWRENGLHIYPASIATLDKFMKFRRRVNSLQHVIYEKSICCFSIFLVKIPKCQDITSFVASFFGRCTFSQENGELSMKNSTIATYCAVQCSAMHDMYFNQYSQCSQCVQQRNTWHLYPNLVRQINRSMISISVSIASRMQ